MTFSFCHGCPDSKRNGGESSLPLGVSTSALAGEIFPPVLGNRSRAEIAGRAKELLFGGPDLSKFAADPTDIADNPYLHGDYALDRTPVDDISVKDSGVYRAIRLAVSTRSERSRAAAKREGHLQRELAMRLGQCTEAVIVRPEGFMPYVEKRS